jgi:hypothetical protein
METEEVAHLKDSKITVVEPRKNFLKFPKKIETNS